MTAIGERNFERNKARGFRCPVCGRRPPEATFKYDDSTWCVDCHYGLPLVAIMLALMGCGFVSAVVAVLL